MGKIVIPADKIITAEQRAAEAWAALRAERDRRLAASDWVTLRNLETAEPVPPEWLAYRQALRDLPETIEDPSGVVWPEL